ncbi:MAG: DUF2384 domain-containing protein [Qipengyuania sp.]|nr:DUF2384 domain-containing protein [Qipengyuania sp.]
MADTRTTVATAHWRKRARTTPLSREQARRQGSITNLAFLLLGKEEAIAFLNTANARLGARPIAQATESDAGQALVKDELLRLVQCRTDSCDVSAMLRTVHSHCEENDHGQGPEKIEQGNPQAESGKGQDECLPAEPEAWVDQGPREHSQQLTSKLAAHRLQRSSS